MFIEAQTGKATAKCTCKLCRWANTRNWRCITDWIRWHWWRLRYVRRQHFSFRWHSRRRRQGTVFFRGYWFFIMFWLFPLLFFLFCTNVRKLSWVTQAFQDFLYYIKYLCRKFFVQMIESQKEACLLKYRMLFTAKCILHMYFYS